jgi:hypothetical protein
MRQYYPLTSSSDISIEGPHRFLTIAGKKGFNPTSLLTRASVFSSVHKGLRGSVSLWFTPLEELTSFPRMDYIASKDLNALDYPLISESLPPREFENSFFGIFWNSYRYPQLTAKFTFGSVFPTMDYIKAPMVYAENLPLRKGCWYHVALTWDRVEQKLKLYVNGVMMAHNNQAGTFLDAKESLQVGNPMMVFSDLSLEDEVLSEEEVKKRYLDARPANNDLADQDIYKRIFPMDFPVLDTKVDSSWTEALNCPFTNPGDFDGWLRQGPQYQALPKLEITSEGLLVKTPDELAADTRTTLWSPKPFEGDVWVEYDFRLESPKGLGLLVICANGTQREDFIYDHGLPKHGSMSTIIADRVRNYHWEYMRRVEAMRTDVETQYVLKNPWNGMLYTGCIPRLEQDRWYRLRFVKIQDRLHGSIDGTTVFDIKDTRTAAQGPIYDFGRIGIRQMYHTTMRYRDLVVYERNPFKA